MATKKPVKKVVKKAAPKKAVKKVAKPAKKVAAPKKVAKPAKKVAAPKKVATKRKPNAAFMKALTPSEILANVIGATAVPRTEAVKKIWTYIKKNGLQDKVNKRNINADDKLKPLFAGKAQITMFELAKYLSKHLS
jgi:chromatin remodeling complex protein RSC6